MTSGYSSQRSHSKKKKKKMNKGLAAKFSQFESDNQRRQLQHSQHQTWAKPDTVRKMKRQQLDQQFRGQEYELQRNTVSNLTADQYRDATSFREHDPQQQQRIVGRMEAQNLAKYEYKDTNSMSSQSASTTDHNQTPFDMLPIQQQMELLMKQQITHVIGDYVWNKNHIQSWMPMILLKIEEILDKYLKDGVYKYCIDVIIMKSTAIARQSEMLKSPKTDYSFNIKIKNGYGLTVVINTHAFRVG